MELRPRAVVVKEEFAVTQDIKTEESSVSSADDDVSGSLVGFKAKSLEEFDELYRRHARSIGFSFRKSTQRSAHDLVTEKYFVCCCEGFRKKPTGNTLSSSASSVKKRRPRRVKNIRTGCKASIRVKLNSEGLYEVVHHITVHNHPLSWKSWVHVPCSDISMAEEDDKSIVTVAQSTSNDPTGKLKMKLIDGADLQNVVDLLHKNGAEDPDFFFEFKRDSADRICCVFWRDTMMKEDYQIFGDVTVMDTTYRKNKYNLISGSFFGINNHWKKVMFGGVFLADDNIESFVWLFDAFKKSMGGVCPVSIFTDQDDEIAYAVDKVFPESRHRLCLWHLEKNVMGHMGELKSDFIFKDAFTKCLKGCVDEEDFESCWHAMITKYELQEHPWFARLYDLRDKWCTAFSKDFFSVGLLSSERSKRGRNVVGFQATGTTSLTDLYWSFKETTKQWRRIEEIDELQCSRYVLKSTLPMAGLLKHAAEIYTLALFKDFEKEFGAAMGTRAKLAFVVGDSSVYEVSPEDDPVAVERATYCCASSSVSVSCSCKNFEECGWLCFHCIKILHMHSIMRIPEQYIVKRWTKIAKKEVLEVAYGESKRSDQLCDSTRWRQEMARKYYNILVKCQDNAEARRILEDGYSRDRLDIEALLSSGS